MVAHDEVDLSELDCKVFVDGAAGRHELSGWIAGAVGGEVSEDGVVADGLEILVDDNDDAGGGDKTVRRGGFLFFDNVAEIYFAPGVDLDRRVGFVSAVLEDLWRRGLPAVAACDYEDRLLREGGVAETAPSPSRTVWFRAGDSGLDEEVTEDEARASGSYSRALSDSSGHLVRQEWYREGELIQIRYFAGELGSIRAEHARDHPGIEFAVLREEPAPAGFRWGFMARYAADGHPIAYSTELVDPDDEAVMMLEYDGDGELRVITKFWDEMPDEAGMLFEYGADGKNVVVGDLEEGDTLRFDEVIRALPEPDFYADGFALPPQLAGTPIPSVRDRFQGS
ncbi:hypothetical protein [Paractinoplanes toevensis]|uniref:Uncharacterized protein n=1 Tax=Paractinoplanes toevensis TaxID=571911 RepID=A0A919W8U9_9ACTN|nr:hypothetical protein [Actinoplanes toevensis]GIM95734.1 hypothetical protein Ato02nite_075270 [Actinoplanes toevensis]